MASEPLSPDCPLGVVCQMMHDEGERAGHAAMVRMAEICRTRIHEPDEDIQLLTRRVLFSYASSRGIDVLKMNIPAKRSN